MCRVKYSRASALNSGSGDVMATYRLSGKGKRKASKASTYQVQDHAGQDAVQRKIDTSLHALEPIDAEVLENAFLQTAQIFRRIVAQPHVVLPLAVHIVRVESVELRSVQQDDAEVVVAVHVTNECRG